MLDKTIKIVVDTVFGNEGCGLITDYFCQQFPKNEVVVNVRHNGGAQSNHAVFRKLENNDNIDDKITEQIIFHNFKHFGSGSFNSNIVTYLSKYFILNPTQFVLEYEQLKEIIQPKVYVNINALVTFYSDEIVCNLYEKKNNLNTNDLGVYETINRNEHNEYHIRIGDLLHKSDDEIKEIILKINQYNSERINDLGLSDGNTKEKINDTNTLNNYINSLHIMCNLCTFVDDDYMFDKYNNFVFESAQGLLLSVDNYLYYPHLSSTHTGIKNAINMIERCKNNCNSEGIYMSIDIEVCYVTKPYFIRKNIGRFDSECSIDDLLPYTSEDFTYIDGYRYGYFDFNTFYNEVEYDLNFIKMTGMPYNVSFALTDLNETNDKIIHTTEKNKIYHKCVDCVYESRNHFSDSVVCTTHKNLKSYLME